MNLGLIGRAGVCRCKGCRPVCPVFESLLFAGFRLLVLREPTYRISVDFVGICSAQPFVSERCISAFRPKQTRASVCRTVEISYEIAFFARWRHLLLRDFVAHGVSHGKAGFAKAVEKAVLVGSGFVRMPEFRVRGVAGSRLLACGQRRRRCLN